VKCLLVNPWIADFAAYNFWMRPLGLYRLAEWLSARGAKSFLLDCLSPFKAPGKFKREPVTFPLGGKFTFDRSFARYGISREEFRGRLEDAGPFDCVFITSVMSYWYPGVEWTINEIKTLFPDVPVVLGGIYATLWPDHARDVLRPDFLCHGPLEAFSDSLADFLGLPAEPSREEQRWYQLQGMFDNVDYWAIRTATGCPFSCTYCASRIVSGRFSPGETKETIREVLFLHSKGVRQIAFYDDALLVDFNNRLGPILEELRDRGIRLAFHTPNGLHARLINEDVARQLVRSNFRSVRLSLETTNPYRQEATGGKVSSGDLESAVKNLIRAGMPASCIGVYLLVGLPGQELSEIEDGVRHVKSLGIRPYLAEFSPIPGTVEWQRLEKNGVVSRTMDPLLTNNTLFFRLFSGYDMQRFNEIKKYAAS